DLEHEAPGLTRSRIEGAGSVRSDGEDVYLTFDGELDPLNLGVVEQVASGTGLTGEIEGPVRISGRLGDLRVETDLEAPQGQVGLVARFDARNLATGYTLDATLDGFELSDLVDSLPSPTTVTGRISARGRGLSREALEGEVDVQLRSSRVARFTVDTARALLRVGGGQIVLDTLDASTNVAQLSGAGALGLDAEHPDAVLRVLFRNDSLQTMRPLLLGDTVIAADTLSPLEREVLTAGGVDPDTLPTAAAVALDGRLRGEVSLRGWVDDFTADGTVAVEEVLYGSNFVRGADLTFTASRLPSLDGAMDGTLVVDSVFWSGRSLAGGRVDIEYTRPDGRVAVELRRHDAEDYRARASFEADSLGGSVELEELALRFDVVQWALEDTAVVDWDATGIRVRDFTLIRPGGDSMRLHADGVLPREGEAEFDLQVQRLNLERTTGLMQLGETVRGLLDLELRVRGTASRPVASGFVAVDSLAFRNLLLTRVEGDVDYENRRAAGTLEAWRGDLLAARVEGSYPMEISLQEMAVRIPPEPVDLRAVVDSFPLAGLSTLIEAVESVQGTVSGELRLAGTPESLDPSGTLDVQGGAFALPDLGIRPNGISGTVSLVGNSTAEVDLRARSVGDVRIDGTVALDPPSNPEFDLAISASGFQAINRRDLQARVGGDLSLAGTYQQPVITGTARVDEGILRIEEFARGSEVIDLSDPRFFDVVDTSFVAAQPDIQVSPNPFLQNLRVEVELGVQRNTWLRSPSMNIEMGGDLVVNWNRNTGDLVLTGELNAIRGTYSLYGRQFQVQEGTIEFVGTPGLNPNLSIQTVTRLRTAEQELLNITASVTGTLAEPRVSLSSDAQPPIAESDLVSYLFFGQPTYALQSQQDQAVVERALGGISSYALGALGSVVQQAGLGIDYLSVSREDSFETGGSAGLGSAFASTQVEIGQYITNDLFVSAVLQPLGRVTGSDRTRDPWGVRAEWQFGDVWTVEGFYEDRFTRGGGAGFSAFTPELAKIFGFFLYREWGY
ncbi:MAG: translocation/assembly module TamB domain-containing protein, partial [Longimicrobiales bacterium]|nr:translocation/assembly module TamB domain-containing protein [Longimicrobiales bacterium]